MPAALAPIADQHGRVLVQLPADCAAQVCSVCWVGAVCPLLLHGQRRQERLRCLHRLLGGLLLLLLLLLLVLLVLLRLLRLVLLVLLLLLWLVLLLLCLLPSRRPSLPPRRDCARVLLRRLPPVD